MFHIARYKSYFLDNFIFTNYQKVADNVSVYQIIVDGKIFQHYNDMKRFVHIKIYYIDCKKSSKKFVVQKQIIDFCRS